MTTAKETIEVTKEIDTLDGVRRAWNPDRGYIIVGFDDLEVIGKVVRMMKENNFVVFDIDHKWLVEGKKVHTTHFCHVSEKEHWIDTRI